MEVLDRLSPGLRSTLMPRDVDVDVAHQQNRRLSRAHGARRALGSLGKRVLYRSQRPVGLFLTFRDASEPAPGRGTPRPVRAVVEPATSYAVSFSNRSRAARG